VEIVPVECLHGPIEIKSVLKPADLREAWVKTAAIKRYPKTAWVPSNRILKPVIERYGRHWDTSRRSASSSLSPHAPA
jgi:hypothetical protein